MRLEAYLSQRQELKLNPQVLQSIEILAMPVMALQELVHQEMLENPTIELSEETPEDPDAADEPLGAAEEAPAPDDSLPDVQEDTAPSVAELEAEFERLDSFEPVFSDGPGRYAGGGGDEDKKMEALQNTAASGANLQEHVFQQYSLLGNGPRRRAIGEHLIYNLDETSGWLGYRKDGKLIPYSLEDLCESLDLDPRCTIEEAEEVLRIVHSLEPAGVGARDLVECLLIQLGEGFPFEQRLIERHLEDLKKNRIPKVAKDTGRSIADVKEALEFLGTLNPFPGSTYGSVPPSVVTPDVVCEMIDGEYRVMLDESYVPRIHVSNRYRKMLHEQSNDRSVREYIKKKIQSAKWLMDSIEQRQSTLKKIAVEIVAFQQPYLDRGIDALKPLKMQDIADKVGVHVSTVSRAVDKKWIQTPRGTTPLKFFFNGGTTNAQGEEESILAVKRKVEDIVASENKKKPLSDEDIAKRLRELGYDIARRTVTKYRKQLYIPSSRQRREY